MRYKTAVKIRLRRIIVVIGIYNLKLSLTILISPRQISQPLELPPAKIQDESRYDENNPGKHDIFADGLMHMTYP